MSPTPHEAPTGGAPSSSPPEVSHGDALGRRARSHEGRLLALGLALSVLVHLLVLEASRYVMDPGPRWTPPSAASLPMTGPAADVMHAYAIEPVARHAPGIEEPVEPAATEPQPETAPAELDPDPPSRRPRTAAAAADASAGGTRARTGAVRAASVRARLFAGPGDSRLWTRRNDASTSSRAAADIGRTRQRVRGRLEEVSDSIVAAHTAARRAREWTVGDADGKRWGVSPDCIHLGSLAIPRVVRSGRSLCEGSPRAEYFRNWDAINAQAAFARARDRFDQRVRAIRKRKDRERAKKNGARNSRGRERGRRESRGHERRTA